MLPGKDGIPPNSRRVSESGGEEHHGYNRTTSSDRISSCWVGVGAGFLGWSGSVDSVWTSGGSAAREVISDVQYPSQKNPLSRPAKSSTTMEMWPMPGRVNLICASTSFYFGGPPGLPQIGLSPHFALRESRRTYHRDRQELGLAAGWWIYAPSVTLLVS